MSIIGVFPRRRKKNIPASIDFNATAGDNTLHLRPQTAGFDCTIHWGDGSTTTAPANGGNVIHSYATAGVYNIKIYGKSFAGFYVYNQAGKEKYVAAYSMGQWAVDTMNNCDNLFQGCNKLETISSDLFRYNTAVTSFGYCFSGCNSLTTIPANLFQYNISADDFRYCFYTCEIITIIPLSLFRYNTAVKSFSGCFSSCVGLLSIPYDLFQYNKHVENFRSCFSSCVGLTEIHVSPFLHNGKVKNFDFVFAYCSSLSKIPSDMFSNNIEAESFIAAFDRCSSLTYIPADIFKYNTKARELGQCFNECRKLYKIPEDLFRYNTSAISFALCFQNCNKLTLRSDIFGTDYANRFNGKTVNFRSCFVRSSFSGTQGTAPALWSFTGLSSASRIENCFGGTGNNTTSISNYNSIPWDWKHGVSP